MATALTALLLLLLAAPSALAKQYTVGDTSGWSQGYDYTTWAQGKTFTVGDTLLFQYSGLHSLDVVRQTDYDNCASTNALQSYSDGSTTITLSSTGNTYFICPTMGHCSSGMKLSINVMSAATNGTTSTSPSGSNSPSTPSASAPSPSDGTRGTGYTNNGLMLGVLLLLGLVFVI